MENLADRTHAVNGMCATSGVDMTEGYIELQKMVNEELVSTEKIKDTGLVLYRLTYLGSVVANQKLEVVVDNSKE